MNFKFITYLIILVLFINSFNAYTQLYEKGIPWGYLNDLPEDLEINKLQKTNTKKLAQQNLNNPEDKSYNYAALIDVDYNNLNSGSWKILPDGTKIWLLAIKSKNAYSIGLIFKEFEVPEGAKVFIYNKSKTHYRGAFTSKNNKPSKKFSILPVKGDEIIIEYQEPFSATFKGTLTLESISHDYMDILNTKLLKDGRFGNSGTCNIDINCSLGTDWQEIKHSVCRLHINSDKFCTGTLVNSTSIEIKPYVLTANHCVYDEDDAEDILVVFNYESPYCNGTDGSVEHSISGATLKATSTNLDFSLIELSAMPPDSFKPYYAGWNNENTASIYTTSIHHPAGDVKKISQDIDTAKTGNDLSSTYNINSFWHVKDWEYGVTEPGSSGAGLFNQNQQIVGMLSGGEATCNDPVNDYFTKFSLAWDYYSDTSQQLKYWLDPENLNIDTIVGFNPRKPKYSLDVEVSKIISPEASYCSQNSFVPAVIIRNVGLDSIKSMNLHIKINNEVIDSIIWNEILTTYNHDTVYFNKIYIEEGTYEFEAIIVNVNDSIDDNLDNNNSIGSFNIQDGVKAKLELTTDKFGAETTWEIKDSSGNSIYSGGPYPDNSINQINEDFCFDYTNYTFTIYDKLGDGICCGFGKGEYTIQNVEDGSILASGGIFSDSVVDIFSFIEPQYLADFESNNQIILINSQVEFTDLSSDAELWEWYFEGGTPLISDEQNPVVQYNSIGIFDVILAINDSMDIITKEDYITVTDSPVVVNFSAIDSTICINSQVEFINLSQEATTFSWTFEGGSPSTSTLKDPVVNYKNSGNFSVTLQINGTDDYSIAKENFIKVGNKPTITYNESTSNQQTSVSAVISGGTPPYKYFWNNNTYSETLYNISDKLYSLAILDSAGCIVTAPFKIDESESVKKHIITFPGNFKIFPNPVSDLLFVQTEKVYEKFELIDISGNLIMQEKISESDFSVNVNGVKSGIYFIILYNDEQADASKIIIE
ncbi:T9SS type A sorting domain-containing protein [Bacteroidota bacterium]